MINAVEKNIAKIKTEQLTKPQQKTLNRFCDIADERGYTPAIKELARYFCVSDQSAYARVKQLIEKGYLSCVAGRPQV